DDLLLLEEDPPIAERGECLARIFRAAHSLRGAARSVTIAPIEVVCHRREEILASVRDGRLTLDAERFALLFETVDGLDDAGRRLRSGEDLGASPLEGLSAKLDASRT